MCVCVCVCVCVCIIYLYFLEYKPARAGFLIFLNPQLNMLCSFLFSSDCCLAEARKSEDREELGILRVSVAIHQQLSGNLVEEEIEEGETRAKTGRKGSVLNPECIWELPGEL